MDNGICKSRRLSLLVLILFFLQCFGVVVLDFQVLKYLFTFSLIGIMLLSKTTMKRKNALVIVYFLFVLLSCVYSQVVHGQSLLRVLVNSYSYIAILFVFIIDKFKLGNNDIRKVLINLCLFFSTCYTIQYLIYPVVLFVGANDSNAINAAQFRMRLPGSICGYILYFYGINQYIYSKNKKFLLYSLAGFFPILMQGFRSLMALTVVFTLLMIPFVTRKLSKSIKWLTGFVIVGALSFNVPMVSEKYNEMMERQTSDQTFDNSDYVRYQALDYFSTQVFTHPGERFFGGGFPLSDTKYGKSVTSVASTDGFWWVDLGIIGLSFLIGIPAVICLVLIVLKCVRLSKNPEEQYIRFALLTVLLGSIMTSMELFRDGNILILGIIYYLMINKNEENRYFNFS